MTSDSQLEETVLVRSATLDDVEAIARFNEAMAWETERRTLDPTTIRRGVAAVIQDARKGQYLVAIADSTDGGPGPVVGQCLQTWEWSDWRNGSFWWLQSVYVVPSHRRRGVFRLLLDELLKRAEADANVVGVRLYVECHNRAAQDVYRRLRFADAGYQVMERITR